MPQIIKADLWKLRFLNYMPEVGYVAIDVQSESNGRPTEPPTDNLPILVFDQRERGARVSYLGFF